MKTYMTVNQNLVSFWQMTSNDKDFRFMATNDLMTELQKDSIKLDDDSERKVITCIQITKLEVLH